MIKKIISQWILLFGFCLLSKQVMAQSVICVTGTVTGGGISGGSTYCYSGFSSMDDLMAFLGPGDEFNQGGGGGAGGIIRDAVDSPNNDTPATCRSNAEVREAHAQADGRYQVVYALAHRERAPRGMDMFRVRYDDGGSEVWIWGGMTTSPFLTEPVPNSLQCP